MKTRCYISTISYNTKEFLIYKLNDFLSRKIISFWACIYHTKEADESKDHFHVFMTPNGQLDTMDLQLELKEIDPNHDLPLGCIDFHKSEIDDWFLYCEHYRPYLISKFLDREHFYTKDDFLTSDILTLDHYYHHAHYESEWAQRNQLLVHLADRKVNPADLIKNGSIPLNMATQVNAFLQLESRYPKTERGERNNHENNIYCQNSEIENLKKIVAELSSKVYNN